jgi:N-ethylmaleimide reductase
MSFSKLFAPLTVGPYRLSHRVIMAPLTRMRAQDGTVAAHALNVLHYKQRASDGGLIIAEASQVSQAGQGYPATPGIHSERQIEGWRDVTEAVHLKGGRIFLQLWHVGRVSHSSLQPNGALPVAPSAIRINGETLTASWKSVPFETPRALETEEIAEVVESFRQGAENAKLAGFDGVELMEPMAISWSSFCSLVRTSAAINTVGRWRTAADFSRKRSML